MSGLSEGGSAVLVVHDGETFVAPELERKLAAMGYMKIEIVSSNEEASSAAAARPGTVVLEVCRVGGNTMLVQRPKDDAQSAITERLGSFDGIMSSITHELNNPLSAILFNVGFAIDEIESIRPVVSRQVAQRLASVVEALDEARGGASHVASTIGDLRPVSRSLDEAPREVDVKVAVRWGARLMQHEVRRAARLVVRLQDTPMVHANDLRIAQIVINLLASACRSTSGSVDLGEVRVSTAVAGGRVLVEVSDNGAGKSAMVAADSHMSVCRDLVASLGGELEVEDDAGQGTTRRVSLPIADAQRSTRLDVPRRAKILVVDDEQDARVTITSALEGEHEVMLFESGAQALAAVRERQDVDVIICNLMMPAMSGVDFFETLELELPELTSAVIFTTGAAFTDAAAALLARTQCPVLRKPLALDVLERLVAETLEVSRWP